MPKTKVLSSRVPYDLYLKVQYLAWKRGKSISDWLKPIIETAANPGKKRNKKK